MNISMRMTNRLWCELHADLDRPHEFALERVAFVSCRPADDGSGGLLLLADKLHVIPDEHYEDIPGVPVTITGRAFSPMLGLAYREKVGIYHVHRHEHSGVPRFSGVDLSESRKFVPDFWKVRPRFPHGVLVLSHDSIAGLVFRQDAPKPQPISRFSIVGTPTKDIVHAHQ